MAIANPRIHMICGICGNKSMLSYKICRDYEYINEGEEDESMIDSVIIHCNNCDSITTLDEVLPRME